MLQADTYSAQIEKEKKIIFIWYAMFWINAMTRWEKNAVSKSMRFFLLIAATMQSIASESSAHIKFVNMRISGFRFITQIQLNGNTF